MKITLLILIIPLMVSHACQSSRDKTPVSDHVPPLGDVGGSWVSADTADMEPSVRNFRGQALLNRDLASISWLASAPYSGGYHTGTLRLNGKTPKASMFRWLPHQALRKGEMDNWQLFSTVKMVPDTNAVMWDIRVINRADSARSLELSLDMIGFISRYGGDWAWWYPYPKLDGKTTVRDQEVPNVRKHLGSAKNFSTEKVTELINGKPTPTEKTARWPSDRQILEAGKYSAMQTGKHLLVRDSETDAVTGFSHLLPPDQLEVAHSGGTATWNRTLEPGETLTLRYVMAYSDNESRLNKQLDHCTRHFDSVYHQVDNTWQTRWETLFQPDNDLLSGTFPVLATDDPKLRKVYYTGPLTLLYL